MPPWPFLPLFRALQWQIGRVAAPFLGLLLAYDCSQKMTDITSDQLLTHYPTPPLP